MTPSPFFHEASGAVRFWVVWRDNDVVGATIGKETLHYRFRPNSAVRTPSRPTTPIATKWTKRCGAGSPSVRSNP